MSKPIIITENNIARETIKNNSKDIESLKTKIDNLNSILKSIAVTHETNTAVGSTTQPVYIASDGKAIPIAHTLGKSVPSDAKFTDTTYSTGTTTYSGTTKLYTDIGTATDGTMTQAAIKKALNNKVDTASIGDIASKAIKTLTHHTGDCGYTNDLEAQKYVPDMAFMSYWNGAYQGTKSNLQYCEKGAFGSAATKNTDYFALSSHTHTKSEVGLGNVDNTADTNKSVKYATSAGSASSASKASSVVDCAGTGTIQIGFSGSGISGDAIKYIAGYTSGSGSGVDAKIKDVSKDALQSWLGLGSLAYSSATIPTITIEEIKPNVDSNEISAVWATIDPGYITPYIKKSKIKSGSNIIVFSEYNFSITGIKKNIVYINFKNSSFVKYKGIGSVNAYSNTGDPFKIILNSANRSGEFCLYIDDDISNMTQSTSIAIEICTVYIGVEE